MVYANLVSCFLNLVLTFISVNTGEEIFHAIADMENLLDTQKHIIESLEDYLEKETKRLDNLTKIMTKAEYGEGDFAEDLMANPFYTFRALKWITYDNQFAEETTNMHADFHLNDDDLYPTDKDRIGAAEGIARLQQTYTLNVTIVADGDLGGFESPPISSDDCYEIGKALIKANDVQGGIMWTDEAYRKFKIEDELFCAGLLQLILHQASYLHFGVDDVQTALKYINIGMTLSVPGSRDYMSYVRSKSTFEQTLYDQRISEVHDKMYETNKEEPKRISFAEKEKAVYTSLCRHEPKVTKKLTCRYLKKVHPFLTIAPFRMERLHKKPRVRLIHDFLSENEIEYLKNISKVQLKSAAVYEGGRNLTSKRTSKVAWISDAESAVAARITRRVAALTGLSTDSAEPLQVANYGVGGHTDVHLDAEARVKDRMVTIMFYLSDVEMGGATAFTKLGLTITPKKGAALLWFNLHPSGNVNHATRHGACPVLFGTKWVATKWLHLKGNEFLAPCNLKRLTRTRKRNQTKKSMKKKKSKYSKKSKSQYSNVL